MHLALRPLCLPLAVLAATALTACGSSSKDTAAPPQAAGTTSSTPSPTPSPSPTLLSKAEFVTKMDAVCGDVIIKLDHLPKPKGEADYSSLDAFAQGTLALFPPYIKRAEALVGQAADKETLTANWLTLEKSDFAAQGPALKKFVADIKAKNQAAVAADARVLDALPDHSEKIAGFMSGYGLKKCAELQNS